MRRLIILCSTAICVLLCGNILAADPGALETATPRTLGPKLPPINYIPKAPGHYSADDWKHVIDSTWGPGRPTDEKVNFWLSYWQKVNDACAIFGGLDSARWDTVWERYFPEISAGVSRGSFSAILNRAAGALHDGHTIAYDKTVADYFGVYNLPLLPGVPLMFPCFLRGKADHFGAGLTPLPDSTALVYKVMPGHPLGLAPGDVILGYDRRRWVDLYREIDSAGLPYASYSRATNMSAYWHHVIASAGLNWHLFDTIDIVKYGTNDTVHLPTSLMIGQSLSLWVTDQLPVPGVSIPNYLSGQMVSWGIITGTRVGYIYAVAQEGNWRNQWNSAIDTLMKLNTTGMVIDLRTNLGGEMGYDALGRLFGASTPWIGFDKRCSATNRLALCSIPSGNPSQWAIPGGPGQYDKPIALLTGPRAGSGGDFFSLAVAFAPRTKVFGKPTGGFFNIAEHYDDVWGYPWDPDFFFWVPVNNAYLASSSGVYLTRTEFPSAADFPWVPYENVWLTRDGVAQGRDDVVEAAKAWIISPDLDQDGILNENDNCPNNYNPLQEDADHDGRGDSCCCVALTGNIDGDAGDVVDISDLSAMVDYLFAGGSISACAKENDVDKSGSVDISDLQGLIDFLFNSVALPSCP